MSVQEKVIADLIAEREKALAARKGELDADTLQNDWIAFITAYLGRAAQGVYRNERENQDYRQNLVKAGGLLVSALVAYDRYYAKPETVELRATA